MKSDIATREQFALRFRELYQALNPEQRQAVDAIEGTVMVLAGPGTGKTQLLAMRIANILQQTQMDPWNILCVTFTESGVVAMRERLLSIMGEAAYYVRIHTFHSFCNEIIQDHPDIFSRARDWRPLSEVERVQLIESLLDALPGTSPIKPFGHPYLYIRDIIGNIQALKQEGISPTGFAAVLAKMADYIGRVSESVAAFCFLKPKERTEDVCQKFHLILQEAAQEVALPQALRAGFEAYFGSYAERLEQASDSRAASSLRTALKNDLKRWHDRLARDVNKQRDMQVVYARYQEELASRGRYDFEDMITQVIDTLSQNDALLAEYQEQFQYILIDEYQDTNGAQNEVVRLLGSFSDQPNIFVVGDDKQSIYRFQGASLNNMLDFYERYRAHVTVVTLRENYRSQANILTAATALISHNRESISKYIPGISESLVSEGRRPRTPLRQLTLSSEPAEEALVAERIATLIAEGEAPESIAVIFRYHRDAAGILRALRSQGVPVRLEAGEDALRDRYVEQLLDLLEFLATTDGDDRLARILHYDWLGFDSMDVIKIVHYASRTRQSLYGVLQDPTHLQEAHVSDLVLFQAFAQRVAAWQKLSHNTTVQYFLHTVINDGGLLDFVITQPDCLGVLQHITRVLEEAHTMNSAQHSLSVAEFIQSLRLLQGHGVSLFTRPWQVADNAVRLMTAHKAKGLEFEHVFIMRLNDKHWGNNPEVGRLPLPHGLVRLDYVVAAQNNEDERRLFYVAMTRARQTLVLTRAAHTAQGRPATPSLFLQELPSEAVLYEEHHEDQAAEQERLVRNLKPLPAATSDELRGWLKERLRTYVFSVTHLNNYLACPRQFYIRNLLRVPTARSTYQALGSAVHGALEEVLRRHERAGQWPTTTEVLRDFEQYLSREILTPSQRRDVADTGRVLLQRYYDHYHSQFSAAVNGEYDFSSHGITLEGIPLTGKVDKIEWVDEKAGTVNVIDYKTGQPEAKAASLKPGGEYHRQIVFYQLLCELSPRFSYTMVSGEIDFIQPSRRGQFVRKRIAVGPDEVERLRQEILDVWTQIKALRFLDEDAGCGECEYCVSSTGHVV